MKIKSSATNLLNKKKNALPTTSKLLKPKVFKSILKNVKDKSKVRLGKEKLLLAVGNTSLGKKKDYGLPHNTYGLLQKVTKNKKLKGLKDSNTFQRTENVYDTGIKKSPNQLKKNTQLESPVTNKQSNLLKDRGLANVKSNKKSHSKKKHKSIPTKVQSISNKNGVKNKNKTHPVWKLSSNQSQLNFSKVTAAVTGLLKIVENMSDNKAELLDLAEPIFLQVECIKIPICPTKQLRFKLPHPLVNELSDILLIISDKKGSKIYPDKAVEHYTELLAKHSIDFIHKVIPVRTLRQEYSQYEMRKKLVDQFDLILADACIIKSLPNLLGRVICYKRKMPIAVHLDRKNLKEHLQLALTKTQMTVKSNGHMSIVQVGHTKMTVSEMVANIVEVSKWLAELFPGGWTNIRSLNIKISNSAALPVYLSLVSPNAVRIPVEQPKKKGEVEDELSTIPGMNVVVRSDGTVYLKKLADEELIDDSKDDEILQEAEKYIQSSKTVRYGESDDDNSDKEADAVTAAVEEEFLNNYDSTVSAAMKAGVDNEDEEDEEESDEEDTVIPISGKKRKLKPAKKQPARKSPDNKKQKKVQQQERLKGNIKSGGGAPDGQGNKGKSERRGTRGGKKNKVSKDQRKALIKRKKAGKK